MSFKHKNSVTPSNAMNGVVIQHALSSCFQNSELLFDISHLFSVDSIGEEGRCVRMLDKMR